MKTFLMTLILLSFSAFASETVEQDHCSVLLKQKSAVLKEQSDMSRDFLSHDEEGSWSLPSTGAFNCEEVQDSRTVTQLRYDRLSKDLDKLELEIARYCPRSYPE